MRAKTLLIAGISILFSISALTVAVAIQNEPKSDHIAFANGEHGEQCQWNHYSKVYPLNDVHGSEEFWACCTHHSFVLEEPGSGTIADRGAWSGAEFDALEFTDPRYIEPINAHEYAVQINDGELIPMTDMTYTLTYKDTCCARYEGLDLEVERGDIITFYRDGVEMEGIPHENNANFRTRSNPDNLEETHLRVQSPASSMKVHLNFYPTGEINGWCSDFNDRHYMVVEIYRNETYYYVDYNIRSFDTADWDSAYQTTDGPFLLPKGQLDINLLADDQIYMARFSWDGGGAQLGDAWNNYATRAGTIDNYHWRILRSGRFYLACEGFRHAVNIYYQNEFVFAWMEKDVFVNGVHVDRSLYSYGGDQVQISLDLTEGDTLYYTKTLANGLFTVIGYDAIDVNSPAKECFSRTTEGYLRADITGTYYFASWTNSLWVAYNP